jgi:nickel-dependent lactate racemase
MTDVSLKVKEHYGDEDRVFSFPDKWEIDMLKMNNHDAPSLTKEEIDDSLNHPIGTETIAELAKGKRGRICIIHDDLTRPTPAYQIVPSIIDQLHQAGVTDDQIFFLSALGTHPPMNIEAFGRKLGYDILRKYRIRNHVFFDSRRLGTHNFVDKGFTSYGTPVTVNRVFAEADLRIGISGLIKKGLGCGGGGKICMPGIASIEAIAYNHTQLGYVRSTRPGASGYWNFQHGVSRKDMQEFARKAGLDVSINVLPNGRREAAGVFAGDVDEAYMAGVKECYKAHSTIVPNKKYDIIVSDSYPQAGSEGLRWCDGANEILRDGGSAVNICVSVPDGYYLTHYTDEAVRGALIKFITGYSAKQWPIRQAGQTIVLDNLMDMHERMQFDPRVEFYDGWEKVSERLVEKYPDYATVAVFPTAAFQFNPEQYPLVI